MLKSNQVQTYLKQMQPMRNSWHNDKAISIAKTGLTYITYIKMANSICMIYSFKGLSSSSKIRNWAKCQ